MIVPSASATVLSPTASTTRPTPTLSPPATEETPPTSTIESLSTYECPLDPALVPRGVISSGIPIRVAFITENGIQLWDEESNTSELLFEADDVTSLAFSGDHQLIAFTRLVEQRRTSLWIIDVDTGSIVELIDHDRGGTYTFSPDGAFFTLVSDTSVSLFKSNGELIARDIVTYPALGITDSYHHPPVKWNAGSRFFTFAVINTTDNQDVFYNPNVTSTIWWVSVDGSATQLAMITGMALDHAFSPDLEQVAFMRVSPKGPPLREMHFADIHDTWDVIYDEGDRVTFRQWNPNGEAARFIFFNVSDHPHIGRLCQDSVPLPTGSESDSPTQQVN